MKIAVDGLEIGYDIVGAGRPVMFLHGWGGRAESFAPICRELSKSFEVCALDFPGFGRAELPREPYEIEQYAEWTRISMDILGFRGCGVVAHSFGARVAILLSSEFPELFSKMVLTGAAGLMELLTVALRYKTPDDAKVAEFSVPVRDAGAAFEAASHDFQFTAALFSSLS